MMLTKLYDDMLQGPWKTAGLDVQYRAQGGMLTFQCTASAGDWIQNFRFWRKAYKNMNTVWYGHTGFDDIATLYSSGLPHAPGDITLASFRVSLYSTGNQKGEEHDEA